MKLSSLLTLYAPSVSGAGCAFSKFDMIRMLCLLRVGRISRKALSVKLGIGEGSTRTLLETLRKAGLARVSIFGCELSKTGDDEVSEVFEKFKLLGELKASALTFGKGSFCIVARRAAGKIASGVVQRDAALLAGASGATVLIYSKGCFSFPQVEKGRVENELTVALRARSDFEDGDVVVLSFSEGSRDRERGAWAAVSTLE